MKNITSTYTKMSVLIGLMFVLIASCERDLSDEVAFATMSNTGEIFTDSPIGLGSDFYFPFLGSKATAFSVDDNEGYNSSSSMRFDVPNADDPEGSYAGAIFRIEGAGRDLTQFDALTFWAKASQGVKIGEMGFGQDFLENKYQVSRTDISLSTNWVKYIIPIPDPSKLHNERGMFWFSAGSQDTGGFGYSFWIDELKFEKLGTIGQAQPAIFGGNDIEQDAFIGIPIEITGLTQTFNTASGNNVTVSTTPAYYDFNSTHPEVAYINDMGIINVLDRGQATITAALAGIEAKGSVTLNARGSFDFAPIPPERNANDVISIFSDVYTNVPVDYYNGFFFDGFQTTEGGAPPIVVNGDQIINYTKLNFVGIGTFQDVSPVNVTDMTHLHMDIKVNEPINSGDYITIQLLNDVGGNETSGSVTFDSDAFKTDEWVSLDIPLEDFGLDNMTQIGLLFFISDATITDIFVDNIYYYK